MGMFLFISLLILIVGIIGLGIWVRKSKINVPAGIAKTALKTFAGLGMVAVIAVSLTIVSFAITKVHANETATNQAEIVKTSNSSKSSGSTGLGYLAVAIAVGLGSLAAGIATGMSAAAAIGAISEDPKIFGSALLFVGLSEGIAIYGLAIAIMLLSRL